MNEFGYRLIAKLAHQGQKYGEQDYYEAHVKPLVEMVRVAGHSQKAVYLAYLHDVVEDTWLGMNDLIDLGVDMDVVYALDYITKRTDEEYGYYIGRVKHNKLARQVKLLDLQLNLANKPKQNLTKRYEQAIERLKG